MIEGFDVAGVDLGIGLIEGGGNFLPLPLHFFPEIRRDGIEQFGLMGTEFLQGLGMEGEAGGDDGIEVGHSWLQASMQR
jgi:hypothetical protein